MKSCGKLLTAFSTLALCASALAVSSDNPYKVIFDRNAFKLNPPNPPPKVEPLPEPPPPNVELTGFSQVGDEKKAWFMIAPMKPGTTEQPQYVSLRVGERTAIAGGSLELKELNDGREETKVIVSGKEATYSMKHPARSPMPGMQAVPPGGAIPPPPTTYVPNNAVRSPTAAMPQFAPGNAQPVPSTQSGVISGTSSSVVAGQGGPANAFRIGSVPQSPVAAPQLNSLSVQTSDGTVSVPMRTLRLPGAQNNVIAMPPVKPMTAKESEWAVEVNRELTKDAVARRELPPLPPTSLTK